MTTPRQQAPDLTTLRPGTTAIVIAVAALALKLPQALAGFLPVGTVLPEWMPDRLGTGGTALIGIAWLAFGAVLLWLRRWLGAVSTVWFCIVSAVSGVQLFQTGFPLWGGWQVLTAAVATVATVVAVLQGACKGSRW
ncbi:MAG: hypothetical protein QM804_15915 [Propionicimonas sp.]